MYDCIEYLGIINIVINFYIYFIIMYKILFFIGMWIY